MKHLGPFIDAPGVTLMASRLFDLVLIRRDGYGTEFASDLLNSDEFEKDAVKWYVAFVGDAIKGIRLPRRVND